MKSLGIATVACAALLTLACGSDRTPTTSAEEAAVVGTSGTIAETATVKDADAKFIESMLGTGAAEIELGKLAAERGSSSLVKQFAQMMVNDHTRADEQLRQIAAGLPGDLSADPGIDKDHQKVIAKLSQLQGRDFDRAYMDAMVDGHRDVIDSLQKRVDERNRMAVMTGRQPRDVNVIPEAADTPAGARINQWAANTLPVVKGHLERAKALEHRVN